MKNHPIVTFKKEQLKTLMAQSGNAHTEQLGETHSAMKQFGLTPGMLLSENEVAKILHCSVQHLRNQRSSGASFPYIKWGRSVRYLPEDVYAAIMACRIIPSN